MREWSNMWLCGFTAVIGADHLRSRLLEGRCACNFPRCCLCCGFGSLVVFWRMYCMTTSASDRVSIKTINLQLKKLFSDWSIAIINSLDHTISSLSTASAVLTAPKIWMIRNSPAHLHFGRTTFDFGSCRSRLALTLGLGAWQIL